MTPLTPTNYYDKNTKALTCSKIKDYTVCPYYFSRKHIYNDIEEEQSDAFMIGGLVDKLLSGEDFGKKYEVVARRSASAKADALERGVTLMLQSQLDEIIEVADAVDQTDAWKTIKENGIFQAILQVPMAIGEYFDSLAGRPDVYWIKDGICYLIDLKTAASADHRKFYYQALSFKYHWQLANYKMLLKTLHPEIKSFRCFNLVVAKKKNIYDVELEEIPENIINRAERDVLDTIDKIANDKEFKKYNPSFDNPHVFGSFDNDSEFGDWEDRIDNVE